MRILKRSRHSEYVSQFEDIRNDSWTESALFSGEAYFQSNDLEAAEKAYRKSLYHKADHAPAHLTMARLMSVKVSPVIVV